MGEAVGAIGIREPMLLLLIISLSSSGNS